MLVLVLVLVLVQALVQALLPTQVQVRVLAPIVLHLQFHNFGGSDPYLYVVGCSCFTRSNRFFNSLKMASPFLSIKRGDSDAEHSVKRQCAANDFMAVFTSRFSTDHPRMNAYTSPQNERIRFYSESVR